MGKAMSAERGGTIDDEARGVGMGRCMKREAMIITGEDGYLIEDVPHLSHYIPHLPAFTNPLEFNSAYAVVRNYFVHPEESVIQTIVVEESKQGASILDVLGLGKRYP